ncbi:hypothetical protein ABZ639_18390 [Saccharomonospora sp. NPDC006951]
MVIIVTTVGLMRGWRRLGEVKGGPQEEAEDLVQVMVWRFRWCRFCVDLSPNADLGRTNADLGGTSADLARTSADLGVLSGGLAG